MLMSFTDMYAKRFSDQNFHGLLGLSQFTSSISLVHRVSW
jgi:hypothetical protein